MARRDEVLRAAVGVLARGGVRALTHGAVDAAAGVAPGTASNAFRTRDALLAGVLEFVLSTESAHYPAGSASVDHIVRDAGALLRRLAGPDRDLALARHAISLEAAWRSELRDALAAGRRTWWQVAAASLTAAGVADAERHARPFLSSLDGLLLDQLRQPVADFEPEPLIRALVVGLIARNGR